MTYPYINNNFYTNLLLDEVGYYSATSEKIAKIITKLINKYVDKKSIITDGTAGVGGNTISFAKFFKKINAVEINIDRFSYLQNNINLHKQQDQINLYNMDYVTSYHMLKQDVIFLDPPWGGKTYKQEKQLRLYLSQLCIVDFCNKLMHHSKIIVLKVPKNFDFKHFNTYIKYNTIYIYSLQKMFIVIIIQPFDKIKCKHFLL